MGHKTFNLTLCIALLATLLFVSPVQADNDPPIRVLVDGEPLALGQHPVMHDRRVYVPAFSLLTALGGQATESKHLDGWQLTGTWQDVTLSISSDSATAQVNGVPSDMGTAPITTGNTLYVPVRWLGEVLGADVDWFSASRIASLTFHAGEEELPRVGSLEHLQALIGEMAGRGRFNSIQIVHINTVAEAEISGPAEALPTSGDFSQTNVQVAGVDEADLVKTDGTHLYQVSNGKVVITRAVPADEMEIVATLSFEQDFYPAELYAEPGRLIVIGTSTRIHDKLPIRPMPEDRAVPLIAPIVPTSQTTKAFVYDTANIGDPVLRRVLELDGTYKSSRKIGDNLYLISNKWLDLYHIMEHDWPPELAYPMAGDSGGGEQVGQDGMENGLAPLSADRIYYFPGFPEANYLVIGAVNLADEGPMDVKAYLGAGENVYASQDNLYATVTRYDVPESTEAGIPLRGMPRPAETSTDIYKFALLPGKVDYRAHGSVPGTVLNRFSMDEYDGHFRIATTTGRIWGEGEDQSKNHLFILDGNMNRVGEETDIAPGERIYAVRFMGERAYMVTFRTVDPLFAIDVSDPAAPKVLGALKIPGYSDYLHPYDENHLIGFGKDTVEIPWKDADGNIMGTNAHVLGMKVSLFDVTDVANPIERHTAYIGDRGTHSDVLYNHKALLFSRDKDLLAFPVDLYEVYPARAGQREAAGSTEPNRIPPYGTFTYQGAYIYGVDPDKGFTLRGRITHLDEAELLKAGQHWHNGDRFVRRILYIDDTLYTLSDTAIKANALDDLQEIGMLYMDNEK